MAWRLRAPEASAYDPTDNPKDLNRLRRRIRCPIVSHAIRTVQQERTFESISATQPSRRGTKPGRRRIRLQTPWPERGLLRCLALPVGGNPATTFSEIDERVHN